MRSSRPTKPSIRLIPASPLTDRPSNSIRRDEFVEITPQSSACEQEGFQYIKRPPAQIRASQTLQANTRSPPKLKPIYGKSVFPSAVGSDKPPLSQESRRCLS